MISLARKLKTFDYFALAFGTMVGTGWLIVMDDWLSRGGPLGAILGFAIGGAVLLPIGYVYGRLVMAMPDAASEIAYTRKAFSPGISFATGWTMILAYLPVCPWESVAVGKIASYVFPALNSTPLYSVAGKPVYLPHLVMGLFVAGVITYLNFLGIRESATLQNWMTAGVFVLFAIFVLCGLARGSVQNFVPAFSHAGRYGGLVSIILVIQIVPFFMTGFESVTKCSEESTLDFRAQGFFRAIILALVVGIVFYTSVIAIVAYVSPWPSLVQESFATAVAFERAFRSPWIVDLILLAALLSLVKIFNGNFIAATRLLFALGRRGLVDERFGRIHPANRTPSIAVISVGLLTFAAVFLGEAILIPVTEVGSLASAVGWLATCASYYRMGPAPRERAIALAGSAVGGTLVLMKILPNVPGHFTIYEYGALFLWIALGLALKRGGTKGSAAMEGS
ncbi:MAG TPA: APC family permease [Terriglobia bacterium]|nr:APC family permease [Terriglobia bacterium]